VVNINVIINKCPVITLVKIIIISGIPKGKSEIRNLTISRVFSMLMQAREAKDMVRKQTGIIYDRHMTEHKCIWDPNYPECPERFIRVLER
jgi:histone deacetylase 6